MAPLHKLLRLRELKILHYNKQDLLYKMSEKEAEAFVCGTLRELRAINVTGDESSDIEKDERHLRN